MGPSYFYKFIQFVKSCLQEKFATAFKGCCLGLFGSLRIFWSGTLDPSVVIYIFKGIGTVVLTASTTLTTCYISYRFDKWKENEKQKAKKSKGGRKAA